MPNSFSVPITKQSKLVSKPKIYAHLKLSNLADKEINILKRYLLDKNLNVPWPDKVELLYYKLNVYFRGDLNMQVDYLRKYLQSYAKGSKKYSVLLKGEGLRFDGNTFLVPDCALVKKVFQL